ncbi:Flp pilus assembly protein CpaB [Qipengyuania atrilutea]|uniref:Flp pilus assembly protein CpaB n=1 Tax=Qipengyuania atrilutea TaxID=2744473 RepID=A0A850GYF8_9SPHN|nr:Flp pilus assembly protein CpaB [Actirhodobacter atriluteus]NVD43526.1 Flp pilus assembly protein CpaB [Actirhodobacter atriluteus]
MGGRNIAILAVAVILGIIAVLFANAWFSGAEERQAQIAAENQMARIVVAAQPMEFGTALSQENLRMQNFPASSVPQGAFTSLEAALQGGRVALRPIVPGEPVLADKVSGSGGRAVLSANLEEGMRAVAIPVSAVNGVAGFVRPGDIVDVLLTRQIPGDGAGGQDLMTDVIMEGVRVLAIDQVSSESATEPGVGATATVEVDTYGAQRLVLANRLGTLTLALRNVESQEAGQLLTVTARDLGDPGLYIAGQRNQSQPAPQPAYQPPVIYAQSPPQAAPARQSAPSEPVYRGPSMSIIRGTESTEYPVGRLGGR